MTEVVIRRAVLADAKALAPRVRAADQLELWDGWAVTPWRGLRQSLALSTCAWTGLVDGEVAAMWGAGPTSAITRDGMAWLIGSEIVERLPLTFLRENRRHVRRMFTDYDVLRNWVDARNTVSIRWLRWLGATFEDPAPFGIGQKLFRRFEMRADNVHG